MVTHVWWRTSRFQPFFVLGRWRFPSDHGREVGAITASLFVRAFGGIMLVKRGYKSPVYHAVPRL